MKTYTGNELAAKMNDGEFDTVEALVEIPAFNARDERQGEAYHRVEIPKSTLSGGRQCKWSIENRYNKREGVDKVIVKKRV